MFFLIYSVLVSHDKEATIIPMEEIDRLNPGQTADRVLQVRFEHHLLPLKLVLSCDGRKKQVKLRPDIGYFIKPLPMDIESFLKKESQLPGMFENIRRSVSFEQSLSCSYLSYLQLRILLILDFQSFF